MVALRQKLSYQLLVPTSSWRCNLRENIIWCRQDLLRPYMVGSPKEILKTITLPVAGSVISLICSGFVYSQYMGEATMVMSGPKSR